MRRTRYRGIHFCPGLTKDHAYYANVCLCDFMDRCNNCGRSYEDHVRGPLPRRFPPKCVYGAAHWQTRIESEWVIGRADQEATFTQG